MGRTKTWKDDPFYGNYSVSDDGDVMNKRTGRILRTSKNNSGYNTVNLYDSGERITMGVHRLVATTFKGCDDPTLEVNHVDGNKNNNHPDNLEWATRGENASHAYRTGLKRGPNSKPVRVIETGEVFGSIKECARAIDGDDRHIGQCLRGDAKTHRGLTFEYADETDINVTERDSISKNYASARTHRKRVRIVETGNVYGSLVECAEAISGDAASISACLAGTHHTHRGYHFEEVR